MVFVDVVSTYFKISNIAPVHDQMLFKLYFTKKLALAVSNTSLCYYSTVGPAMQVFKSSMNKNGGSPE